MLWKEIWITFVENYSFFEADELTDCLMIFLINDRLICLIIIVFYILKVKGAQDLYKAVQHN